ncbi:hypothetical protein HZR84_05070 [Hyphobacterium sp. CCMP332]|nr:hypothetical protein HZR84_05070 [Hyphobacterium sp. CCMP332]
MMQKFFSLFFLFISAVPVFGQSGLEGSENYAVNDFGDTIRGFIEEIGESRITIASIVNNQYKVRRLSTKTVTEYHLNDTVYKRVSINLKTPEDTEALIALAQTSKVFLKVKIDGPASLFERNVKRIKLMDPDINSDAKGFLNKVPESQLFLHFNPKLPAVLINDKNFYEISIRALGDKKRVRDRLNSGYYTFENLEQMLLDYNYLVENNLE